MNLQAAISLRSLFTNIPIRVLWPAEIPEVPVNSIVFDSRAVQPGSLFVALQGGSVDGHRYITAAIERGAAAVVGMQVMEQLAVPYIQVEETRKALAYLSAAFYGFPAHQLTIIGVTGTDGKTTTSNLLYRILSSAGMRAGMISTVNAVIGERVIDTGFHVTTPESPDVQRYLAEMVAAGLTHVILESTSHGLAQQRVAACEFDIGIITNITHEHLDFHGTYEEYRDAKASLFTGLAETALKPHGNPRLAILNRDDRSYAYLNDITTVRQVDYSLFPGAAVWADEIHYQADGYHFTAHGPNFVVEVHTHLYGSYNVSNCLAALSAAVLGLGIAPEIAAEGIAALEGVPGRMEMIDVGQDFTAMVDFAHTPNALEQSLRAARELTSGRVLAVFGSAGLRDRAKRRMMAGVSAELADITILTAEDPRTESLDDILAEMAAAPREKGGVEDRTFYRIPDRGQAIRKAVALARPGDLVISCGKGHEQSMAFGSIEYPWDDRIAMRAALSERLGISGPQMPYLPTGDLPWTPD